MSDVRIYHVYYSSSDFASSCDPIRLDLVVDGIRIKSQSTIKYSEYRDVEEDMINYCQTEYEGSKVMRVCSEDGHENYKFSGVPTEGNK